MTQYVKMDDIMQFPIRRDHYDRENGDPHFINGIETMMEYIETLPTIDALPVRHGYWIDIDEQSYTWKIRCSCCGHERSMLSTQGEYPNYCENCGCRTDAERKEENGK